MIRDPLPQFLGKAFGHIHGAVGEDEGKLIATQAGQDIAFAQLGADDPAQLDETVIPGLVAVGVIDLLEIVQVHKTQGMATAFVTGVPQADGQTVEEFPAVDGPGQ